MFLKFLNYRKSKYKHYKFEKKGWLVIKYPYVIYRGGQAKSLFYLTRVGTWSKKAPKHPYVIKERSLITYIYVVSIKDNETNFH